MPLVVRVKGRRVDIGDERGRKEAVRRADAGPVGKTPDFTLTYGGKERAGQLSSYQVGSLLFSFLGTNLDD